MTQKNKAKPQFQKNPAFALGVEWSRLDGITISTSELNHLSLDDAELRRIAATPRPDGGCWLDKPANGKRNLVNCVRGYIAFLRHKLEQAAAEQLPPQCSSMKHVQEVYGIPISMQQYARSHGCAEAFEANNRVNILPLLHFFTPYFQKAFTKNTANISGLENFEGLDSELQLARLRKEQADALADEREERRGQLVRKSVIYDELLARGLQPIRDALLHLGATCASVANPTNPAQAQRAIDERVGGMLRSLSGIFADDKP